MKAQTLADVTRQMRDAVKERREAIEGKDLDAAAERNLLGDVCIHLERAAEKLDRADAYRDE
jgi:hypothetical protein